MLKINNKGQSLVMFVLIIPIFLLILTLVYDVGNAIYEKDRLSNTNYLTIEYRLNNIDKVTEEYKDKYAEFYDRFCCIDDGHAAERVVKAVFGN